MSDHGHDLHDAFPNEAAALHRLKLESEGFRQLAERHHRIAREIHRIEAGLEAAAEARLEALKKERLAILDDVARLVAGPRAAA